MSTNRVWKKEWSATRAAKKKARRWKRLGIISEGDTLFDGYPVRTVTVLRDGQPLELLHGADVGRALQFGATRITDWTKAKAIPAAISLDHARCFTGHQAQLLKQLGAMNARGANPETLEERAELIKEIWARWNE